MFRGSDTRGRHRRGRIEAGRVGAPAAPAGRRHRYLGALAATTVVAGAGVLPAPAVASVPVTAVVQHEVELTAFDWSPFFASLQELLDMMNLGTVDQMLGLFHPGLTVDSQLTELLDLFNPDNTTFGEIFDSFGLPLGDPLYLDSGPSLLGTDVLFEPNWADSLTGTPLGDIPLDKIVDLVFGGDGEGANHSMADLLDQLQIGDIKLGGLVDGLSGISWVVGIDQNSTISDVVALFAGQLDNYNTLYCDYGLAAPLVCPPNPFPIGSGHADHDGLSIDSSLNDWLSALLKTPTEDFVATNTNVLATEVRHVSATTLGEYLQQTDWGDSGAKLADQSLGDLLGLSPNMTWNDYLANMAFGGSFFHPGTDTIGSQSIGDLLTSWLPEGSGYDLDDGAGGIADYLAEFFN